MAEKDKKRYEGEMSKYKASHKGVEKGRKKKRAKDPDAPKRALSAFFWFCNDERAKVKAQNPDATVGEVAKELGRRWNECTEDQKSKYEALAAKDKARYEKVKFQFCFALINFKIFLGNESLQKWWKKWQEQRKRRQKCSL